MAGGECIVSHGKRWTESHFVGVSESRARAADEMLEELNDHSRTQQGQKTAYAESF